MQDKRKMYFKDMDRKAEEAKRKKKQEERNERIRTKRAEIQRECDRLQDKMMKERKEKETKAADKASRKKLQKSALRATWDDCIEYSEKELKSIFMKHGAIAKIWMEDLENKAIVAYEDFKSCMLACDDKEFEEDFSIKVRFLGDRSVKRKRDVGLTWRKRRRPGTEFASYERQVLSRLVQMPFIQPHHVDLNENAMDLGHSD